MSKAVLKELFDHTEKFLDKTDKGREIKEKALAALYPERLASFAAREKRFKARTRTVGLDVELARAAVVGHGGIVSFRGLHGADALRLLDSGNADGEWRQGEGPSFREIAIFLGKYPKFTGNGYIVGPYREDERIVLDAVAGMGPFSREENDEFTRLFRQAKEFRIGYHDAYAWFD